MKKTLGAAMAALAAAVMVSACGGGGGGGGGGGIWIDPGYGAWYDVYGRSCGYSPKPGCNFYSDGYKIIDVEDPYFKSYYALEFGYFDYYNYTKGRYETYYGWGWESPNGIIYDDWGDALNNTDGQGRDFSADVAAQEQTVIQTAGKAFAEKYDLTLEKGMQVAKIAHDYALISKDRARTEADYADFSKKMYGLDLNKVKGALAEAMKGNKVELENMVNSTALDWKTSPATMKRIMKAWYGKQAEQFM